MKRFLFICLAMLFCTGIGAKEIKLVSPDKKLTAVISINRTVSVTVSDETKALFIIDSIGMDTDRGHISAMSNKAGKVRSVSVSNTVIPPIKEKRMAVDYVKEHRKVRKGDMIAVDMASGGGWIARIY